MTPPAATLASNPREPHLPFLSALGGTVNLLAPKVKEHVLQPPGTSVTYRGQVRVWRDGGWRGKVAGWLLRVGALTQTMFPETGETVPFVMRHDVAVDRDGRLSMTWSRTFDFGSIVRRFDAVMYFRQDRTPIIDWVGARNCLHVELCPKVEDERIIVSSAREWIRLGPLRIPIPGFLKGRPSVCESQEPDGSLRIRVEIHNTILGQLFGYEGTYRRVP